MLQSRKTKQERSELNPIQAIIYDLDGTLVDSEPLWYAAESELIAARGDVYRDEVRAALVGLRLDGCIAIIREAYSLTETVSELREELLQRMMNHVQQSLTTRDGAEAVLAAVHALPLATAIASSSPLSFIEGVIQNRGWDEDYFPRGRHCLFSADDVAEGKPAPDVYLAAARSLQVDPHRCVAIEDSTTGARAAVAAGMICFAVWDPFHSSAADFAEITPHCFANLKDCIPEIRRLTQR